MHGATVKIKQTHWINKRFYSIKMHGATVKIKQTQYRVFIY